MTCHRSRDTALGVGGASLVLRAVRSADLLTSALRPVSFLVDCALSPRRFITQLLGPFAVVAPVLAALGIYGVIAASVTARTREIGIRMAPGAAPRTVRRQMLGEAAVLALLGVADAFAVSRIVSSLAFGVSSVDPIAFAAAPVSLLLSGARTGASRRADQSGDRPSSRVGVPSATRRVNSLRRRAMFHDVSASTE